MILISCSNNNNIHFSCSFQDSLISRYQDVKPSWILIKQEMMKVTTGTH